MNKISLELNKKINLIYDIEKIIKRKLNENEEREFIELFECRMFDSFYKGYAEGEEYINEKMREDAYKLYG